MHGQNHIKYQFLLAESFIISASTATFLFKINDISKSAPEFYMSTATRECRDSELHIYTTGRNYLLGVGA